MYKQIRIARVARKTKSDQTKLTIFVRVFPLWVARGSDFTLSTKICIDANKWSDEKKQLKGSSQECLRINLQLNKLEEQIYQLFAEYLTINPNPNPNINDFKSFLNFKIFGIGGDNLKHTYAADIFDRYLNLHSSQIGIERNSRFKLLNRYVNDFNIKKFGTTKVDLIKMNYEWWNGFREYLYSNFAYSKSTVNGYLKMVKTAMLDLYKSGILNKIPFENCSYEKCESKIRYLDHDDICKIINFNTKDERLQRAKEIFLFACNTGLAYKDLKSLNIFDIVTDKQGRITIEKARGKTDEDCCIPLSEYAISILGKYKNHPKLSGTNLLLPMLHINCYNRLLKLLAVHCKINKKISTHTARHTMATTFWLNFDGSYESLQKILGHKKMDTTMIYGKVMNEKVKNEASLVFKNQAKMGA